MSSNGDNGRVQQVLIVDDHPIVRQGLQALINQEPDLKVCGTAEGLSQAMRAFWEIRPDLLIVDISLQNGSGIELIREVKARSPEVRILVSSMHDETLYAERALRAGASGYINKSAPARQIVQAIRQILEGGVYLSERMTGRILDQATGGRNVTDLSPIERLSDRELQVFEKIGQGITTRQIATLLHVSIKTVETYREHIKVKLGLNNATELTQHAVQWVLESMNVNRDATTGPRTTPDAVSGRA